MRRLADRLGIPRTVALQARPRQGRGAQAALISEGFEAAAERLEAADGLPALGAAYRAFALERPHLYRLMFEGPLPRERLAPRVEARAAAPVIAAAGGDPDRGRALFAFAHGMVILELDDRFPPGAEPGRRLGARPQRVRLAPPEVLDDPLRVADRLAAEHQQRHVALPGQRLDLVAVARRASATRTSRPRSPRRGARAPRARTGTASSSACGSGRASPSLRARARRAAVGRRTPASRSASGWRVPERASRPASRSRYQATVASSVSSWGAGFQPELALGLGRAVGPPLRGAAHLDRRDRRRAGQRLERLGERERRRHRQLAAPAARRPTGARGRRTAGPACSCGCRGCSARPARRARRRAAARAATSSTSTMLSAPST